MHELHRAEYLQALGVTSYMPRFVLPHAPAPRQAQLPPAPAESSAGENPLPRSAAQLMVADAEPQLAPEQHAPAQRKPESQPEVLREIGVITDSTRIAPTSAQPAAATPVAPPQQAVEPFVLSCWWLGDELLAVDSREPGAALPVEALFNNIARALNWHELPREQDRLRWPLAENRFAAAAAASDARDTCSSWLEAASARRPVKSIWLMGRQARDFCAPLPLGQPVTDWNGISIVAMPSLTQLLQQPERKRALWQLLQNTYPAQSKA